MLPVPAFALRLVMGEMVDELLLASTERYLLDCNRLASLFEPNDSIMLGHCFCPTPSSKALLHRGRQLVKFCHDIDGSTLHEDLD